MEHTDFSSNPSRHENIRFQMIWFSTWFCTCISKLKRCPCQGVKIFSKKIFWYLFLSSRVYLCIDLSYTIYAIISYLSSLCLYFIRTVPVLTSTIHIEFPPQVATLEVVFVWSLGSGSNTTSQIWNVYILYINNYS